MLGVLAVGTMNSAVDARCVSCGLLVTGVVRDGLVYPSDRSRPAAPEPIEALCMRCASDSKVLVDKSTADAIA